MGRVIWYLFRSVSCSCYLICFHPCLECHTIVFVSLHKHDRNTYVHVESGKGPTATPGTHHGVSRLLQLHYEGVHILSTRNYALLATSRSTGRDSGTFCTVENLP